MDWSGHGPRRFLLEESWVFPFLDFPQRKVHFLVSEYLGMYIPTVQILQTYCACLLVELNE